MHSHLEEGFEKDNLSPFLHHQCQARMRHLVNTFVHVPVISAS